MYINIEYWSSMRMFRIKILTIIRSVVRPRGRSLQPLYIIIIIIIKVCPVIAKIQLRERYSRRTINNWRTRPAQDVSHARLYFEGDEKNCVKKISDVLRIARLRRAMAQENP